MIQMALLLNHKINTASRTLFGLRSGVFRCQSDTVELKKMVASLMPLRRETQFKQVKKQPGKNRRYMSFCHGRGAELPVICAHVASVN